MSRKRARVDLPAVGSRAGSEVLGNFKPKASTIGTLEELVAFEIPEWTPEPADQYEFFEYLRHTEMLLNVVLTSMVSGPRVSTVLCFARHTDALKYIHDHLFKTFLGAYREMRLVQNVGDTTGTSASMVTSLVLGKMYYLVKVLRVLSTAIGELNLRPKTHMTFVAPFISLRDISVDTIKRGSAAREHKAMLFKNGEVRIPKPFNIVPRIAYATLYTDMILVYPDLRIGEYSQFNVYQQTLRLADRWYTLNLACPELSQFIWALYCRHCELISITFEDGALELDMPEHYRRPETLKGRDPLSIRTNKQLKVLSDTVTLEDSQMSIEQQRLKKANMLRYATAAQYQIEVMGMLAYMFSDLDILQRVIAPRLTPLQEARLTFGANMVASLIRYSGGTQVLALQDPADDHSIQVPLPYGGPRGGPSMPEDYVVVYRALLDVLSQKQQDIIDDSSKRKLCEQIRHSVLPLGIRERYCLMKNLVWSENPLDHETVVVVRAKLNFQMRYWELFPSSYFLGPDQPLPARVLYTTYIVNSLTSQDRQKRSWSSDAVVCASTLDIGRLEAAILVRRVPFILQFGRSLYLVDGGRVYECANIPEAILAWFCLAYGILNGNFFSPSGAPYRVEYLEQVIYEIFGKLPTEMRARFSEHVVECVRLSLGGTSLTDACDIEDSTEDTGSGTDDDSMTDDDDDERHVYGMHVLFK